MKALLFTLEYPPHYGGVANYYGNLVKHWPKPLEIFVLDNKDKGLINNQLLVLKWLPSLLKLWKIIKQEKINYVLVGQILPLGTVAYFISKIIKIKYAVFFHGMDFTFAIQHPIKSWLTRKILKNSDKIICCNSYVAGLVQKFYPEIKNKINIVNPGVSELKSVSQESAGELKEKYNLAYKTVLLSIGRLVKRKGFLDVIKSLPEVLKKIPNLIYVIVGSGIEINNLRAKISELKLADKVIIIINADDQERNAWLNLCDIFIMPAKNIDNDFEGFGIVYLEANIAGKPVIACQSGGVSDAVVDGVNGLLVDSENLNQISEAIIKLSENFFLRQKLCEQGCQRALKNFNWQKQISQIYKLIYLYDKHYYSCL